MNQDSDKFTSEELARRMSKAGVLIDEGLLADSLSIFFHDNEVKNRGMAVHNAHDNILEAIEDETEVIVKEEAERMREKYESV